VIELDGEIYLVEIKWWNKPLDTGEVSPHLVRVFSRHCARGLLISYSGFTAPAFTICKEALARTQAGGRYRNEYEIYFFGKPLRDSTAPADPYVLHVLETCK